MTRALIFLVALLAAAGARAEPAEEELTRVLGTHVWMPKPDHFVQSDFGTALVFPNAVAQIQVAEIARPFEQTAKSYSKEATEGLNVTVRREEKISGYPGLYLRISGPRNATGLSRWVAAFGNETYSVVLTAVGPSQHEEVFDIVYRRALLGARFDPRFALNPFEGLPFFIAGLGSGTFRFASRLQSTLMFTLHGTPTREGPDDPAVIVSFQPSAVDEERRAKLCTEALAATPRVKDIEVVANNKLEADGMSGCEALARAIDIETGRPMVLYEANLFEPSRYYTVKGLAGVRFRQQYVTEFARFARQIRRR